MLVHCHPGANSCCHCSVLFRVAIIYTEPQMVACGNFNGNFVITSQRFSASLTCLPEVILALCAFGFGAAAGITVHFVPLLADFKQYTWLVATWLTTCCVCDLVVSSAIAYQLWTSRSGFKPTDKILTKLTLWTVNTGMIPAAVAVADVITFACLNNSLVHLGTNIMLAKLYSNSLLASLNRRRSQKQVHFQHVSNTGYFHMSAVISTDIRSSSVSPIPNPRDTSVHFKVSTHESIDPEPEGDRKQATIGSSS